jgi:crotonobetainyl-CoA:carnitine CoA-transferase CaiB-like acyl-CoA transferase
LIASKSAAEWERRFAGKDVCVVVVKTLREAVANPQFVERGIFAHAVCEGARRIPALPVPIASCFRLQAGGAVASPILGECDPGV